MITIDTCQSWETGSGCYVHRQISGKERIAYIVGTKGSLNGLTDKGN